MVVCGALALNEQNSGKLIYGLKLSWVVRTAVVHYGGYALSAVLGFLGL